MTKFLFQDDYSEGAHSQILDALREANDGQQIGYGKDHFSALAKERIQAQFNKPVDVHLVSSGTQANMICLSAILKPHHGIIAPTTGHINVHEAGAIEATGHKIISVVNPDGKLTPELISIVLAQHPDEHTVKPGAIFLSQATEMGTIYNLQELTALVRHAKEHGLLTYLDGARLAQGLAASGSRMTLSDIAEIGLDVLYLGGTKNGALCGEAIVIINHSLEADFRYHIKQRGGLLAKGRVLGAQFARFFAEDNLWYRLGHTANDRAQRLTAGLERLEITFLHPQFTNQIFPILEHRLIQTLENEYGFYIWQKLDNEKAAIRLVCSWATPENKIDQFLERVAALF